ncbi:hypothetical protein PPTG_14512 [Phytophthora nicotianae INRA-310]|uniref:Uncharacterized protein n=2 Tax=Phytophthora nicotianae TaxID=4792 RepID=W2PUQ6_PHYN3|nr:hypothetical protein PPTG_14512 [Phytophthora nicotianae INRA-310]ETN04708.1 hypothetical protein PPTG_14512 [Phytophthora nicotianae INRA-310]
MVLPMAAENLSAASVTVERTERFKNSLLGKLGPSQPINEAEITFLSLQQVTLDRRALMQMNPLIPRSKWCFDEMKEKHTRSIELVKLQDADCLRQKECTCGALSSSIEIRWNIKSRDWPMQFGALMH